jgi:hypothetical protein
MNKISPELSNKILMNIRLWHFQRRLNDFLFREYTDNMKQNLKAWEYNRRNALPIKK